MGSKPIEGEYIAKDDVVIDDPDVGIFVYERRPKVAKEKPAKELNDTFWGSLLAASFIGMIAFFISYLLR